MTREYVQLPTKTNVKFVPPTVKQSSNQCTCSKCVGFAVGSDLSTAKGTVLVVCQHGINTCGRAEK